MFVQFVLEILSMSPRGCPPSPLPSTAFPAFQETLASSLDFYRWAAAALLKAALGVGSEILQSWRDESEMKDGQKTY